MTSTPLRPIYYPPMRFNKDGTCQCCHGDTDSGSRMSDIEGHETNIESPANSPRLNPLIERLKREQKYLKKMKKQQMATDLCSMLSILSSFFGYRAITSPFTTGTATHKDFVETISRTPILLDLLSHFLNETVPQLPSLVSVTAATKDEPTTAMVNQPVDSIGALVILSAANATWHDPNSTDDSITIRHISKIARRMEKHGFFAGFGILLPRDNTFGDGNDTSTKNAEGVLIHLLNNLLGVTDCTLLTPAELDRFEDQGNKMGGFKEYLNALANNPSYAESPYIQEVAAWNATRKSEIMVGCANELLATGLVCSKEDVRAVAESLGQEMQVQGEVIIDCVERHEERRNYATLSTMRPLLEKYREAMDGTRRRLKAEAEEQSAIESTTLPINFGNPNKRQKLDAFGLESDAFTTQDQLEQEIVQYRQDIAYMRQEYKRHMDEFKKQLKEQKEEFVQQLVLQQEGFEGQLEHFKQQFLSHMPTQTVE
ncbi:hypothetical protein DFH27DRAFT_525388 [Peziza echinospora]|nr:hypothetical protein DFH27DRAFT_525388 [Peziza echinospora]